MFKIIIIACVGLLLNACNSGSGNKKSETSATENAFGNDSGWIALFDGKSTDGWHQYGKGTVTGRWKVSDGAVYVDTAVKNGEADLVTNEEFENFDLKLEWKISKGGNSGVIFYIDEDTSKYKQTYNTGPEMQVVDNEGHPDGRIIKHQAGDLYDMIACSTKTVKPVGEWNQSEIISLNGKLDFLLNGVHVVSTTLWDDNWKSLIANSKFKDWPGFGLSRKGSISLQDHGDAVWFRNIMIKKL